MSKSSKNSIRALMALLLCTVLLAGMGMSALAASFDPDTKGSLTIQPKYDNEVRTGGVFSVYYVAKLDDLSSPTLMYELTGTFAKAEGVDVNDLGTSDKNKAAASKLAAYTSGVGEGDVWYVLNSATDGDKLGELKVGLYLIVQTSAPGYYTNADPFLVSIPMVKTDENGYGYDWNYDVTANPKMGYSYNPPSPSSTSVTVSKVWDDAGYESNRPSSVSVTLYRNDAAYQTATLNAGNSWTYTWRGLDTGYTWRVDEDAVPTGYWVSTSSSGNSFTITNHYGDDSSVPLSSTVSVEKIWNDDGDAYGMRTDSVEVTLYRNNAAYATVELNAGNSWEYLWTGLSESYTWTVAETNVPEGYVATSTRNNNHYAITNTYGDLIIDEPEPVPLNIGLNIYKNWIGDEADKRPDSIEVSLYRDGEFYRTVTLTADMDWTYSIPDADTINYAWEVREENIPTGYSDDPEITSYYNTQGALCFNITNTSSKISQTGMLQWPIPVLTAFGVTFLAGGATVGRGKKKREREE